MTENTASPASGHNPMQVTNNVRTIVIAPAKSVAVAYLLWFVFGGFGAHKFYLRQTGLGVVYLGLLGLGWLTTLIIIGWFILAVLGILMIVDLFLIPGRVARLNQEAATAASQL